MTDDSTNRRWRWGVWHPADREWHAELERRNTQQLERLCSYEAMRREDAEGLPTKIPKVIHQVWLGPNPIPPRCAEWMKSWRELHPDWTYRLWRDEDAKNFTLRNERAFREASNYGEKSDILRYEILNQYGGVYVDVDMQCLRSFNGLVSLNSFVVGISNTGCVEINNAVVASIPNHPILIQLVDKIGKQVCQPRLDLTTLTHIAQMGGADVQQLLNLGTSPMATIERTGPGLMTRTFMEAIGWSTKSTSVQPGFLLDEEKKDVVALPVEFLFPLPNDVTDEAKLVTNKFPSQSLAVHYWERTWMA